VNLVDLACRVLQTPLTSTPKGRIIIPVGVVGWLASSRVDELFRHKESGLPTTPRKVRKRKKECPVKLEIKNLKLKIAAIQLEVNKLLDSQKLAAFQTALESKKNVLISLEEAKAPKATLKKLAKEIAKDEEELQQILRLDAKRALLKKLEERCNARIDSLVIKR